MLSKSLGSGHQYVAPQVEAHPYHPGDTFLLCSDGVTDVYRDSSLKLKLESGISAKELVDAAVAAAGRDNTTAVIVQVPAESAG